MHIHYSFTKGKDSGTPLLNFFPPKKSLLSDFSSSQWDCGVGGGGGLL